MILYDNIIEQLGYSCDKCGGLCCNLNGGSIKLSNKQMQNIDLGIFFDYITKNENSYNCKFIKRCWFLKGKRCTLSNKNKPIECQIYPIVFWKFLDNIYCEFIPCPYTILGINIFHENYNKIDIYIMEELIKEYDKEFTIQEHVLGNMIINHSSINKNLINNLYKSKTIIEDNACIKILYLLFNQICLHPALICLDNRKLELVYKQYIIYCDRLRNYIYPDTIQNIYILAKNKIIQIALFLFYKPYNNNIDQYLSERERSFIQNDDLSNEKTILLYKYYRSSSTIWEEI